VHRQEHDGVCGAGGRDHCHPAHHSVQRQEGRQFLHTAQELLQPDQPEGAGGRALAHPVPVRRAPPHRQSFHAVNPTHAALRAQWH